MTEQTRDDWPLPSADADWAAFQRHARIMLIASIMRGDEDALGLPEDLRSSTAEIWQRAEAAYNEAMAQCARNSGPAGAALVGGPRDGELLPIQPPVQDAIRFQVYDPHAGHATWEYVLERLPNGEPALDADGRHRYLWREPELVLAEPDLHDRLPRRRNPRIWCEEVDGTWIHGSPHNCPRSARGFS
jgi:hypothetical protein